MTEVRKNMCRRGEEIGRNVSRLQKEREALEQSVLDMANKTHAMDLWLSENESKIPDGVFTALLISAVWPVLHHFPSQAALERPHHVSIYQLMQTP